MMPGVLLALAAVTPPELGDVQWTRDFDAAAERADGRPILVLFDEVPGCSTCLRYGEAVLRHPLIVEAAESLFIPVAVYNNVGGKDRATLNRFSEPSWNNPVVRVVDKSGKDLAPRLAGDYRVGALAGRMVTALRASGSTPPDWLVLLSAEAEPSTRMWFSMGCFWSGEACLGGLDSVLSTRTGFRGGREVVEVRARKGEEAAVESEAIRRQCGRVMTGDHRFSPSPKDDRHALKRHPLRAVPMTPLQASRVNAALAAGAAPWRWLSPRQRQLAERTQGRRDLPDASRDGSLRDRLNRLEAALARRP